jgi:hypothetical protein
MELRYPEAQLELCVSVMELEVPWLITVLRAESTPLVVSKVIATWN